jgi:hypothetical protein
MKKIYGIVLVAVLLCISGCATAGKNYTALAKEKSFDSFFPVPSTSFYFADLDEAYDFINTAHAKFTSSSAKKKAKGLAAKLVGPPVVKEQPVTVCYFILASNGKNEIDLAKINEPLEKVIRDAISATLVFMVFYQDRGTSLSNFHLADGWAFNSNSQFRSFNYNKTNYEADYPVGWSINKAFSYLKKEIN